MTEGVLIVFITMSPDRDGLYPERKVHQVKAIGHCDGHQIICLQIGDDLELHHASHVKVITPDQVKYNAVKEDL